MEYAYITGAASGIGREIARFLAENGIRVFLTDIDELHLKTVAKELNAPFAVCNVVDWDSQAQAFLQAISKLGRIDYVFPIAGIGENTWIPASPPSSQMSTVTFVKPNLSVIDVNVYGFLYTVALAIQQFRRQDPSHGGYRGKILCPGSIMGIYPSSASPIYNLSKHAITGFVRSYGKQMVHEKITINAFCPSSISTNFSNESYYSQLEKEGLLTPMEGVLEVVEKIMGASELSGEVFEIGPNYKQVGLIRPPFPDYADDMTRRVFELIELRGNPK